MARELRSSRRLLGFFRTFEEFGFFHARVFSYRWVFLYQGFFRTGEFFCTEVFFVSVFLLSNNGVKNYAIIGRPI